MAGLYVDVVVVMPLRRDLTNSSSLTRGHAVFASRQCRGMARDSLGCPVHVPPSLSHMSARVRHSQPEQDLKERKHITHSVEMEQSSNVYSPAIYTPVLLPARLPRRSEGLPRLDLGLGTTSQSVSISSTPHIPIR